MTQGQSEQEVVSVEISVLEHGSGLELPAYSTAHSAGVDLRAALGHEESLVLQPGERGLIPTGLRIGLPDGYEAQVRPRSGLAVKAGVTILNSPGTIDADYRGEVKVILINHGDEAFEIRRGDRIAQLVVSRYARVTWKPTGELSETERGEGGFGHTGV